MANRVCIKGLFNGTTSSAVAMLCMFATLSQSVFAGIKMPGRAVAFQSADIMAPFPGIIVLQQVANGSSVKAGDVLFRIDDAKARAKVAAAEARLEALRVKYDIAKGSYERRAVVKQGVSKEALELSLGEMKVARAQVKEAEVALASSNGELGDCIVRSPIDGVVGSATKGKGDFVSPTSGPLINISTISPIRIRFALSNSDFLRLFDADSAKAAETSRIKLTLADGRVFREDGRIEYIENVVDVATDSIRMYALFQNKDMMIRPGSSVTVELEVKAISGGK